MKQLCLFIFIGFFIQKGISQTGTLKGTVRDAQTKGALAGVSLYLAGHNANNTTNEWGSFVIDDIPAGNFEMNLTYIGYETEIRKVNIRENEITYMDIDLKPGNLELANVVVSGKNNHSANMLAAIDIQLRPINSSQDILKMVPGLFIAQHAGGGKAEQIFLRGFDLDHGTDIQISVDGMPVNMVSHAHGQGYADLHFLIPELVEKIRFEKGPYQSRAGNMATAGFVAFQTPDFMVNPFVKLEIGSYNAQRLAAAAPIVTKEKTGRKTQWWAGGEYLRSDQYFESPQDLNRYNVMTKFSTQTNRSFFSLSASTFGSSWLASGQIPQRAVEQGIIGRFGAINDTEGGITSRSNLNLHFQQKLNEQWRLETRAWYAHYRFNLYSDFTFFLENPIDGDGIQQKEKRDLFGTNTAIKFDGHLFTLPLETELAVGFRQDDIGGLELNHAPYRQFRNHLQKGRVQETNLFSYWNSNLQINRSLQVNLGLRYDWFKFGYQDALVNGLQFERQSSGVVSPKLNLKYDVHKKLQLFLSSGIGFHSNDSRLIIERQSDNLLPKVYGLDAGLLIKPTDRLLVKIGGWWMYSQQEFVYVGDAGIVEAGGASRRIGLDLSTRWQLNDWLYADADLNLTKARSVGEPKGNDYIPLAANFTSSGGLTAKNKTGLSASLRYRYIGDRPANEDGSVIADGYFLLDAMATYRYKKMELGLGAQNLLNTDWNEAQFDTESRLKNENMPISEIHFTPGSPLNLRLSFTYFF